MKNILEYSLTTPPRSRAPKTGKPTATIGGALGWQRFVIPGERLFASKRTCAPAR